MKVCAREIENINIRDRPRRRSQLRDLGFGEHMNPVAIGSNIGALPGR